MSYDFVVGPDKRVYPSQSVQSVQPMRSVGTFRLEEARPFDPQLLNLRVAHARSRTAPMPSAFAAPIDVDSEKYGLVSGRRRDRSDMTTGLTLCALASVLIIIMGFMGGVPPTARTFVIAFAGSDLIARAFFTVMYWQFTASVSEVRDLSRPYIMDAVNHTLSILSHVDQSAVGAEQMVHGAVDLTNTAVPALQHALNQSAAIVDRLERLAQHPVLQLSLTNGVGGADGR